ncbi:hypothetical protein, partial [Enterococcus dongliensis]|uniref:hypothetical protein n=1 Tax=Enterococcus dongliensis TaxID=2559925 RepID=UPI00288CF5BD
RKLNSTEGTSFFVWILFIYTKYFTLSNFNSKKHLYILLGVSNETTIILNIILMLYEKSAPLLLKRSD